MLTDQALDIWYLKHKDFLNELTVHPDTGNISYTHKKLVAAYKSIKRNLSYLFTYKKDKNLIPNTTNLIKGGVFSPLKIVDDYLDRYKKKRLFNLRYY